MPSGRLKRRAQEYAACGLPVDVPHERSTRRSKQTPHLSLRVRREPEWRLRRIAAYLRKIRMFSSLQDVDRAAERIAGLHGDDTLRWLKDVAYREGHQPQGVVSGEQHPRRKLDWPTVRSIRELHAAGGWSQQALARRFGVSQPTIGQVLDGTTWRDAQHRPQPSIWQQHDQNTGTLPIASDEGLERLWADLVARFNGDTGSIAELLDRLARSWLSMRQGQGAHGPQLFDEFWAVYPRKVGKGEARRVWYHLKPSRELVSQMLTTLDWQVRSSQWTKDHGQFIPHPATWLRQERWDDEPPKALCRTVVDWRTECDRLHGGRCGNPTMHSARMDDDAERKHA